MTLGHRIGSAISRQYCQALAPSISAASRPFAPQSVDRRRDDQHHQRDLEIEIGDGEAPEGQDVEAVGVEIDADVSEQHRHEAEPPERRHEGEGERHAGEIGGDAAEGHRASAAASEGRPPRKRRERERKPEQRAEGGGGGADLKAQPIGEADRRLAEPDDVGRG